MITFDEQYYLTELPKKEHAHFSKRGEWINMNIDGSIYIAGAGYGYTVKYTNSAIGIEKSEYAYNQSVIKDRMINADIKDIDVSGFTVLSWNMLDCMDSEEHALKVIENLKNAKDNIHIFCVDDGGNDAKNYDSLGYFIRTADWWLEKFPEMKLVEYHKRKVYNVDSLKIPLSWGMISD